MTGRRRFLRQSASWAAGLTVLHPARVVLPLTRGIRRTRPQDWLPDPADPAQLRSFAMQALDASRQAGAQFADVRIGEVRTMRGADLDWQVGYGVRVLVDGTWGFAYGQELTPDAIAAVAHDATRIARGYAAVNMAIGAEPVELAPIPPATGEWTSPADISPFAVPIDDHDRLARSYEFTTIPLYDVGCVCQFFWEQSTRIFASTEGAMTTQHLTRGDLRVEVSAESPRMDGFEQISVPSVIPVTAGFEAVLVSDMSERILETAHEVIRRAELPVRRFEDEGRFPVILDGMAMGQLSGTCFSGLLDGNRLSGEEADASGTTYLQPSTQVLNETAPVFSPLINVRADRALPHYTAQRWDDEGVVSASAPLVEQGHVRRYLVSREIANTNPQQFLFGCTTAPAADQLPLVGGMHLTLAPASGTADDSQLMHNIRRGLLVRVGRVSLSSEESTGVLNGAVYEIKQGREVARVFNVQFFFQTRRLWKQQLTALGDASTVVTSQVDLEKGMPWQTARTVVTAPAALLADVDVSRVDVKTL